MGFPRAQKCELAFKAYGVAICREQSLQNMIAKLTAAELRLKDGRDNPDTLTENLQRALAWTHAEKLVLNEFRRVGWRMGFDVDEPDASYSMNLKYGPSLIDDTRQAPESESPFWSANDIGIAQHYGVPTRFLDWTFNPMFAIFFRRMILDPTSMRLICASGPWTSMPLNRCIISKAGSARRFCVHFRRADAVTILLLHRMACCLKFSMVGT